MAAGEARQNAMDPLPPLLQVGPGTRLVAAIAPELTMGLVRPSPARSIASSELNGRPVALTPSFTRAASGPSSSQTSANTKGLETLMIAKPRSASPAAWTPPLVPTTHRPNSSGGTAASAG